MKLIMWFRALFQSPTHSKHCGMTAIGGSYVRMMTLNLNEISKVDVGQKLEVVSVNRATGCVGFEYR